MFSMFKFDKRYLVGFVSGIIAVFFTADFVWSARIVIGIILYFVGFMVAMTWSAE